jgi:hypothetical protein
MQDSEKTTQLRRSWERENDRWRFNSVWTNNYINYYLFNILFIEEKVEEKEMSNLETALGFYQSFLTEKELEDLRTKAVMMTSPQNATERGLPYTTLLQNNLFNLVFEQYKLRFESERKYLDQIREKGL